MTEFSKVRAYNPEEAAKAEAASRVAVRAAWTVGAIGAAAGSLMVGYGIAGL